MRDYLVGVRGGPKKPVASLSDQEFDAILRNEQFCHEPHVSTQAVIARLELEQFIRERGLRNNLPRAAA